MPQQELEIKLLWENGVSFEMTAKKDAEDPNTIIKMDKNACLAELWDAGVKAVIMAYLEYAITNIGIEMKAK